MYIVARKSADLLRMSLVTTAAMLAISLLALVGTTNTAEAEDSLPENGKIAFIRSLQREQGGTYYIYTVNPDGSSLSRLTNGIPQTPIFPAWSPDGTQIAFKDSGQIGVIGADGSNLRTLTANKLSVLDYRPSWFPDEKRLAFVGIAPDVGSGGSVYISDIYTVDLDGSNITNITNSPEVTEARVDVSPDGSQMCLYRFTDPFQKQGIYVMNVDGSNPTQLTDYHGWECAWSPDRTKIAYSYYSFSEHRRYDDYDVYVMNADGSGKINLTKSPKVDEGSPKWGPSWSPDGTKIVFHSNREGDLDIYTMDADGSEVTQVTNSRHTDYSLDWQPLPGTTVHQPDTGGPSLLLVAIALLISGGVMFYAGLKRRMHLLVLLR